MDERSPINWVGEDRGADVPRRAPGRTSRPAATSPSMLSRLPKRRDVKITLTNGVHSSPLEPEILWNWLAFLADLRRRARAEPGRPRGASRPSSTTQILGAGAPTPPLPRGSLRRHHRLREARAPLRGGSARARPHGERRGLADAGPARRRRFELGFEKWPPREARADDLVLRCRRHAAARAPGGGRRGDRQLPPRSRGAPDADDARAGPVGVVGGDPALRLAPARRRHGRRVRDGAARPRTSTIVGPGSVDLWLRSSAADTDLQVTLTEIRPDGLETYVQSGWLRASHRRLDKRTLDPPRSRARRTSRRTPSRCPPAEFALVRVGHLRRRARLPRGLADPHQHRGARRRPHALGLRHAGRPAALVTNEISRSAALPSRVVLPILADAAAPPELPPCPGLRGQPCRSYVPAANGG